MGGDVDGAEGAGGGFAGGRIEEEGAAQGGGANEAGMVLRGTSVDSVFEAEPGLAGVQERGEDFAPQIGGVEAAGRGQGAVGGFLLEGEVAGLELGAVGAVQAGGVGRIKERPGTLFADALHEEVRKPQGLVELLAGWGGAGARAGEEWEDVAVPGFEPGAGRAGGLEGEMFEVVGGGGRVADG